MDQADEPVVKEKIKELYILVVIGRLRYTGLYLQTTSVCDGEISVRLLVYDNSINGFCLMAYECTYGA